MRAPVPSRMSSHNDLRGRATSSLRGSWNGGEVMITSVPLGSGLHVRRVCVCWFISSGRMNHRVYIVRFPLPPLGAFSR